jgi:hypothetical protein
MSSLVLVHKGGSRKTVEVVGAEAGSYPRLLLAWPLAGMYVLDLRHNVIRHCDGSLSRRKAIPFWSALSLEGAKEIWQDLRARRKEAMMTKPKTIP